MTFQNIFSNKKVLILGGLGFIGSNLARQLVGLGADVTVVDSMGLDYGGNLFNVHDIKDKIRINFSDIRDEHGLSYLVKEIDYLFSLAGQVSHVDSMKNPYADLEINARGQLSILEACRKYNPNVRIIYTSTRQVYGKAQYLPIDENHPICPVDINGINKITGEYYYRIYYKIYGIQSVILRLTNTYGPGQLVKHNRQGFIGWFIRKIVKNEEIELYGDGKQVRDLNYVSDVVDALLTCSTHPEIYGKIFNLGAAIPITLKDLVAVMIKIHKSGSCRLVPFPEEIKKIDIGDIYMSIEKIHQAVQWSPKISLEEGLSKTFEFYHKYGSFYW